MAKYIVNVLIYRQKYFRMTKKYPFLDKVTQGLVSKEKSLKWLASEIGRTDRWFYSIKDFEKIEFGLVEKISSLLEINFPADYAAWRLQNNMPPILHFQESQQVYLVEKKISVQIKITGTPQAIGLGFADLLKKIKQEGANLGLEIE